MQYLCEHISDGSHVLPLPPLPLLMCVYVCVSYIYVCVCVCVVVNSVRFLGGPLPSECLALTIDWFLGNQKEWRVPTRYQMRTDCLCKCTLLLDFCLCPLLCKITRKPLQMINPSHITGGCFYFSSRQQLQCFLCSKSVRSCGDLE